MVVIGAVYDTEPLPDIVDGVEPPVVVKVLCGILLVVVIVRLGSVWPGKEEEGVRLAPAAVSGASSASRAGVVLSEVTGGPPPVVDGCD